MADPQRDPPRHTPEQLRWLLTARARPGQPGSAAVSVLARNAMIPELAFDMMVDWHSGAEAADVAGGVSALKALQSPFPQARFCPTGGVNAANAKEYLALPNVICVGGSWVAPPEVVRAGDWERLTLFAKEAAALGRS